VNFFLSGIIRITKGSIQEILRKGKIMNKETLKAPLSISVGAEARGKGHTRRAARAWRRATGVKLPQAVKLARNYWEYKELLQFLESFGCTVVSKRFVRDDIVYPNGEYEGATIVTMESPARSKRFWVVKGSYISELNIETTDPEKEKK